MRKIIAAILLIAAVAGGLLWYAGSSRVTSSGGFIGSSNQEARLIEKQTLSFLEDIRFKDFAKAATYHSVADRKNVNVSKLIEDMFKIKPELLDIVRYEVVSVELDSSQTRARVKIRTVVRLLNTDEVRNPEIILYWEKDPRDGWVMRLQSSLR